MSRVNELLARYLRDSNAFEVVRDALHALDPEAMRDVLAAALDPAYARALDLCVMTLADVGYPPAFEAMRRWLEHEDTEGIALPAAAGLDHLAGGRFNVDRFWGGDWEELPATLRALAAWWDAGEARPRSEAEWLAAQRAAQAARVANVPPPDPRLSAAEDAELRPALIALVQAFRALDPRTQHRLEVRALQRVLSIHAAGMPDSHVVQDALAVAARFVEGEATDAELAQAAEAARSATKLANAAAAWNAHHGRCGNPAAKAAAHVAQGVLYVCSAAPSNRLQGLHNARDALIMAGRGVVAVREELARQRAEVDRASGAA